MKSITGFEPNEANPETTETINTPLGKVWIYKVDPYGFRRLKLENGIVPEKYDCDYTTHIAARVALNSWIGEVAREEKKVEKNAK